MFWHLLNQFYVNISLTDSVVSVLEEVVSSELQLVQVLVSGQVSSMTMNLHFHGQECFSPKGLNVEYRT